MNERELPTLAELLSPTCFSEVARRIGRNRGFVWELAHGRVLRDMSLVPPLARALHQPEQFVHDIVVRDQRKVQLRRRRRAA